MNFGKKTVLFLATGFGTGRIPVAPGTFGTLPALPLCYFLATLATWEALTLIIAFIGLAILLARLSERWMGRKDPGCIVIDEMAGMLVTMAGLPFNLYTAAAGFVVFRVLDIVKPFPIRNLERGTSGGIGIVIDDVAAGIIGNIALRIGLYMIENI